MAVIERQGAEIGTLHAEIDQLHKAAAGFWPQLDAAKNERNLLAAQLADLRGHFDNSEADRAARLEVIHSQGAEAGRLRAEVDQRQQEIDALKASLEEALRECSLRATQLEDVRARLAGSEAEQAAAWLVLKNRRTEAGRRRAPSITKAGREPLPATIGEKQAAQASLAGELQAWRERQDTLENHWTARWLKKLGLWPH